MKNKERKACYSLLSSLYYSCCFLLWGNQAAQCSCISGILDPPRITWRTWGIEDTLRATLMWNLRCSGTAKSLQALMKRMSPQLTCLKKKKSKHLATHLVSLPLVVTSSASSPALDYSVFGSCSYLPKHLLLRLLLHYILPEVMILSSKSAKVEVTPKKD